MTEPLKQSLRTAVFFVLALILLALIAPALDTPGLALSSLSHTILVDIGIAIVLALSLNLILGMTGQFSLGHAGFLAAGAYTAIVLAGKPEWFVPQLQFWHNTLHLPVSSAFTAIALTGMLAGAIVAAILGFLVGLPALRLRGDYLAIATLGFGEIVATLITNNEYLGRSTGLDLYGMRNEWLTTQLQNSPAPPLATAVLAYRDATPYLISSFWVFATVLLTLMIVRHIKYSTTGRALLAIREDLIASESVGIPTTRYKVAAFVLGAGLAGLAGGLLAHHKPLNPESFRFMRSIEIVLFVILGGQGSITGSVLAAILITILPQGLREASAWGIDANVVEKWRLVVYAAIIILTMLFRPQGIFGRYEINDLVRWLLRPFLSRRPAVPKPPAAPTPDSFARQQIRGETDPLNHAVLDVCNLGMSFGGLRAVDNFNLTLRPRELVGLIGPNGAGKTTVFNVLTGVYTPTDGQVFFHGSPIAGLKPHRISNAGVARTFQNIRLFGNLSVIDNVQIAQHVHHQQGIPAAILRTPAFFKEEALSRQVALELLGLFHLQHLADEQASSLSYGDQRRLEIARALATRPRLLLLDEPAAGMNPTEKRQLMDMINAIRDRFHLTILLIEHDMKVVMGICQRLVVLDYGKTIAAGPPDEIRKNPAVIEAYLGASAKHR